MLLVKKGYFYLTLVVCCTLILLLGIAGYTAISNRSLFTFSAIKYHSENCIFIAILSVIVVLTLFFLMNRKSVKVLRELDKIAEISRYGKYYTGDYLKKLGSLGERIDHLFLELNSLNEMKSLRISALSKREQFLLENVPLKLMVIDVRGSLQGASRVLLEAIEQERSQIVGKNIEAFLKNVKFSDVIKDMENNRGVVMRKNIVVHAGEKSFESTIEFIPIFNVKNQLSDIICISEKETILTELSKKAEKIVKISTARRRITDFLKPKKGR